MATEKHLRLLREGKDAWNRWRRDTTVRPNLSRAKLIGENLGGYDLHGANLQHAILPETHLRYANLQKADLSDSIGRFAVFSGADLRGANLKNADLRGSSFRRADLGDADLEGAVLRFASMVEANVQGASFRAAQVYGISAWGLVGEPKDQAAMVIQVDKHATPTTVDDLDTAQLLFLLLDNPKIADVIDTASRRIVLLLGRFAPTYKRILDAIKKHLLENDFVPVLFDFERPKGRDLTETVASLAHMACFVVADLSGAKSIPQELSYIVPYLPSVPVIPLMRERQRPYAMFEHFRRFPWVKATVTYRGLKHLMSIFDERVLRVGYEEAMKARGIADASLPGRAGR